MRECWGPSEELLHDAAEYEFSASWDTSEHGSHNITDTDESGGTSDKDSDFESDLVDGDLLDSAETIALTDVYRQSDDLSLYLDFEDMSKDDRRFSSTNSSPRKRHHTNSS